MNATNDDSVAREYRYVVVLADGRVYDPDNPINKEMKELLQLELPKVPEEPQTEEGEAAERREQLLEILPLLQSLREKLLAKLSDLLAQGWVPLRETPFGYGCLLVLTRPCPTDEPPKKRGSTSTSKGRGGDMTKRRGR